jgi:hypothetical protein
MIAAASVSAWEIQQMPDGRAGYRKSSNGASSADSTSWQTTDQVTVTKKTDVVIVNGSKLWWDQTNNWATPVPPYSGSSFYLGTANVPATSTNEGVEASASVTVGVNINEFPRDEIDLSKGPWTDEATNGLGVTNLSAGFQLAFDAVTEVAQAAKYSLHTVPSTRPGVFACDVAVFDKGDNAALDMDIGIATGSHATDFSSVTSFVAIHFDGNDLSIKAHSDDDVTPVAPVDSTLDAVDDTIFHLEIDYRSRADVRIYIDGVRICSDTTFALKSSGEVRPVAMIEKTSDDTTADIRIFNPTLRMMEQR